MLTDPPLHRFAVSLSSKVALLHHRCTGHALFHAHLALTNGSGLAFAFLPSSALHLPGQSSSAVLVQHPMPRPVRTAAGCHLVAEHGTSDARRWYGRSGRVSRVYRRLHGERSALFGVAVRAKDGTNRIAKDRTRPDQDASWER